MSGIIIEMMSACDIPEVCRLERLCFSSPWSEKSLEQFLNRSGSIFLTAKSGCLVAGYVGMYSVLDEGNITNIAVFPEYRRMGVANALLTRLCEKSRQAGISFLTLEVRESNKTAIDLYAKNGFEQTAIRRNYYIKPTENAIIMTKEL